MASPKLLRGRVSVINGVYSITTVTAGRMPLFADRRNALLVIDALRDCEAARLSRSLTWVVMPDHLHWLMQLRAGSLQACMQRLKSRSGRGVARSLGRAGGIWQPGYHDHAIRKDASLRRVADYLLHNPVRAGLCGRPEEYPYLWCRWGL